MCLLSCILQLLFLFHSMQVKHDNDIHCTYCIYHTHSVYKGGPCWGFQVSYQAVCVVDVQHFQPRARERVWGGVLESGQEQGMNGVTGQGVNSGSSVLDSTQSHHWGNHLHCLCLHPRTSVKTAWLQKNKGIFIHAETPGLFTLYHLATRGFTCYYLGPVQKVQHSLSFSVIFRWLACYHTVSYLHRCVFNLWLALANICKERMKRKLGLAGVLCADDRVGMKYVAVKTTPVL